jgi:deoxyribonuclease IV
MPRSLAREQDILAHPAPKRPPRLTSRRNIGKGTIGLEPFRILLNDLRLAHAAFIAETPIDQPGDDRRNVEALKKLVVV